MGQPLRIAGTLTLLALLLWSAIAARAQPASRVNLPLLAKELPTPTATATLQPTATATTAPASPTATLEPTQTPAEVLVLSSRSYVRSIARYVVGELLNNTPDIVFLTSITARFYNAGGQLVATETGYALLDHINPGGRSPFRILLSNPPADITRYELTVTPRSSSILAYRDVTVLSQQTRDNFGVEVFGEVRNDAGVALRGVEAVVTFYDAGGSVVDVASSYASPSDVAAGATSIYSIKTFDQALTFASYQVQAEGYIAP